VSARRPRRELAFTVATSRPERRSLAGPRERDRSRSRLERMNRLAASRIVEGDPIRKADGKEGAVRTEADAGYPCRKSNGTDFGQ
jgi:hypothetical protein